MGSCLSSSAQPDQSETATVIAVNGELRECPTPINVLQVLTMLFKTHEQEVDDSSFGYVLCNSDSLCYDDYIPAMKLDEHLQPSQIYFLVPTTRLQYRLSATDMAAMAVKASLALQKRDGKRKKASISPVYDGYQYCQQQQESRVQETITLKKPDKNYYARSGSIKRLQRYSSRRAKLAVRSFRLMLSTIYE